MQKCGPRNMWSTDDDIMIWNGINLSKAHLNHVVVYQLSCVTLRLFSIDFKLKYVIMTDEMCWQEDEPDSTQSTQNTESNLLAESTHSQKP